MILTKFVKINCQGEYKNYLKKLGYSINNRDFIYINVFYLYKNSGKKIDVKCDICGRRKTITYRGYIQNTNNLKENYCCSKKCSTEKSKSRLRNKYNVDNVFQLQEVKQKSKQTKNNNYGNENFVNFEKRRKTNLLKYKYEEHLKNKNIRNKIKNTCKEKYGVDIITKNKEIHEKQIENSKFKKFENNKSYYYNNYNLIISDYKIGKYNCFCQNCKDYFTIDKNLLNNRIKLKTTICTNCNPIGSSYISSYEYELKDFLLQYCNKVKLSERKLIHPYHLDLYLPDLNIAIEFNGIFWHSSKFKNKYYHYKKSYLCKRKNVKLIHIWEDDWIYNKEIIKSKILEILGINKYEIDNYDVKKLSKRDIIDFLKINSIEKIDEFSYGYGIIKNNNIKSIICFNKDNIAIIENKKFNNIINSFDILKNYINKDFHLLINNDLEDKDNYFYEDLYFHFKYYNLVYNRKVKFFDEQLNKIYNSGVFILKNPISKLFL